VNAGLLIGDVHKAAKSEDSFVASHAAAVAASDAHIIIEIGFWIAIIRNDENDDGRKKERKKPKGGRSDYQNFEIRKI
jgi:hypothetical protein